MRLKVLYCGVWQVVAPLSDEDCCELETTLVELGNNKKRRASAVGMHALWERIPRHGPRALGTELYHCINEKDAIYEFIKGDLRVLCFEADGAIVVCSHVLVKKTQKTPARDVRRAVELKRRYLQALKLSDVFIEVAMGKGTT